MSDGTSITHLKQTVLHGEGEEAGDCMRAALASLLGLESLEGVPHFCRTGNERQWWEECLEWLREEFGYSAVWIPWHPRWTRQSLTDCVYVMSGPSPRFSDEDHVVVAQGPDGTVIHDPHPDNTGIGEWKENGDWMVMVLIPTQPAFQGL